MEIAQALKKWRKEAGLTQAEVAYELGIPPQNYARWESGQIIPSASKIKQIAEAFHMSADVLLGIEWKD